MREDEQVLRKAETWDADQVVVNRGVPRPRAVVSVAFSRDDFETVSGVANSRGMKTSEFIRTAALDKARAVTEVTLGWAGASQAGIVIAPTVMVAGTSTNPPLYKHQDQELQTIG